MLFSLLKNNQPLLEEETIQWLFDVFSWALNNFGSDVFHNETELVLPNNEYFPGSANNSADMASIIFEHVKKYVGLSHWPCILIDESNCLIEGTPKLLIAGAIRGSKGVENPTIPDEQKLPIGFHPEYVKNPEALIAYFAHTLSHYLGSMAQTAPPGGDEYWPHAAEVLAVFLGFGLIFSNSAYTFKRNTCGSCAGPIPSRTGYLSQFEMTYAFAIFCVLKDIDQKSVLPHLKKSLRSFFKKSIKDINARSKEIAALKSIHTTAVAE